MKTAAAIFLFLVNATWAFIAYLLYRSGVPAKVIVIVVAIGVLFGNVAVYGGVRVAAMMIGKSKSKISN